MFGLESEFESRSQVPRRTVSSIEHHPSSPTPTSSLHIGANGTFLGRRLGELDNWDRTTGGIRSGAIPKEGELLLKRVGGNSSTARRKFASASHAGIDGTRGRTRSVVMMWRKSWVGLEGRVGRRVWYCNVHVQLGDGSARTTVGLCTPVYIIHRHCCQTYITEYRRHDHHAVRLVNAVCAGCF